MNFMAIRVVIDDRMLAFTPLPSPSERMLITRLSSGIFLEYMVSPKQSSPSFCLWQEPMSINSELLICRPRKI